jgi:hypothetical protein
MEGFFDACVFEVHDKLQNQAGGERQVAAIDVSRDFWPGDPAKASHFGKAILGNATFRQGGFWAARFLPDRLRQSESSAEAAVANASRRVRLLLQA